MNRRKEIEIHTINYQLTDQDYKNIFSRIFWRFWWILLIFIGFILTGGYFIITNTAENTVKQILEQETIKSQFYDYKSKLLNKAQEDIDEAKNSFIKEIKKYEKIPYSLTNNSIKLFDENGKVLIIEFGRGKTGQIIKFKEHFENFPYIQVSISDVSDKYFLRQRKVLGRMDFDDRNIYGKSLNIKEIKKDYFKVFYGLSNTIQVDTNQVEFTWIAIGY